MADDGWADRLPEPERSTEERRKVYAVLDRLHEHGDVLLLELIDDTIDPRFRKGLFLLMSKKKGASYSDAVEVGKKYEFVEEEHGVFVRESN